jgi:hypothetical protein
VRRGVRGKNTPRRPNVKTRCDFTHTEGVVGDIDMTLKCQFLRFRLHTVNERTVLFLVTTPKRFTVPGVRIRPKWRGSCDHGAVTRCTATRVA